LSAQSAFFSPAKYGLLPELLPHERLSWGNGIINLGTFVAIITGIPAGGLLSEWFSWAPAKWTCAGFVPWRRNSRRRIPPLQ
jgi:predicted MFS family arabinose efflux permease